MNSKTIPLAASFIRADTREGADAYTGTWMVLDNWEAAHVAPALSDATPVHMRIPKVMDLVMAGTEQEKYNPFASQEPG